jgi:uncharacterized protein (TIGR03000 family)
MKRGIVRSTGALLALALLTAAGSPGVSQRQPVYLRVLLPEEDAELKIGDHLTKQTGNSRLFVSPPLEPGQAYTYTLTATWEPNNYTTVIRTRKVSVQAGREVAVDLRKADPKNPDKFVIRYVPTPEEVVEAMCKIANVRKGDVVYDLGCGDGRIVITAVKEYGAKRGVGVDLDPARVKDSRANAKKEGVADRVEFRRGDVLDIKDLGEASVVMLYMGEDVNLRLMPILKKTLRPGSRIVSHDFGMGDWKPERRIEVTDSEGDEHVVYLWKI